MAGLKEIKIRIKSVKNTKKITYAMKLVAATKMRGAQEAVLSSRSYSDALKKLLGSVLSATGTADLENPLLEQRQEVKNIKLIVVGANRGLCGSYNSNVNKAVSAFYENMQAQHPGAKVNGILLGKKVEEHCKRLSLSYEKAYTDELSEDPNEWPLGDICKELEVEFRRGEIDAAYVIYTKFKSALSMTVKTEQLLPVNPETLLTPEEMVEPTSQTTFEPSAEEVFAALLPRMIRMTVHQGALDAKASEYGSRMTAMDTATKNAGELIDTLTLTYNKLRQASITSEILDIVGGANALD